MRRFLTISAVAILSSGWIVPLYFSGEWLLGWLRHVVTPAILNTEAEAHSFPYLHEATQAWFIAAIWLGAAVFFWAAIVAARWVTSDPGRESGG
jgi:hypothetical protein